MAFRKIDLTESQKIEALNLYRNNMTDQDVADYFGIHIKTYQRWLKRRVNAPFRQRIKQVQVQAIALVRQALLQKAIGQQYKPGRPRVIENGKVVDEGEPATAAIPGNMNAIQYWLQNCDPRKVWRNIKEHALTNSPKSPQLETDKMTDKELSDYILRGIQDGLIPMSKLQIAHEETRESLPLDKAVDATFTEETDS